MSYHDRFVACVVLCMRALFIPPVSAVATTCGRARTNEPKEKGGSCSKRTSQSQLRGGCRADEENLRRRSRSPCFFVVMKQDAQQEDFPAPPWYNIRLRNKIASERTHHFEKIAFSLIPHFPPNSLPHECGRALPRPLPPSPLPKKKTLTPLPPSSPPLVAPSLPPSPSFPFSAAFAFVR